MEKYRIEEDFLGKKEVDIDAFYGIQTARAMENFCITGYTIDKVLINALAIVKKAAALANSDTGQLEKGLANAIVRGSE